jgi:tetratricopeptide (TPR) repeat protein
MSGQLPDFDSLWDYTDPAATEAKFRALLPEARSSGDDSNVVQLLTQIARAQGLQHRFDDAHATLDEAEKLLADKEIPLARVRYLLERGRVFNSSGKPAEARPLFEQAFELARSHGLDFYAIDAAHMIAIVEPSPQGQLKWNESALELAEKSNDARARNWRGSLYNNIGWTYFDQKQFDRAIEVFERAVTLRAQANKPRELRIARYCIAKTLRMQGKIDQALAIDRELIAEAERANQPDGYFHEELAECLLASGKSAESKPHFRRAHEELSKDAWLVEYERARLDRLKSLGE